MFRLKHLLIISTKLIQAYKATETVSKFHTNIHPKCSHFVQFSAKANTQSLGVLSEDLSSIINLSDADSTIPNSLVQYIESESTYKEKVQKLASEKPLVHKLSDVKLLAPVTKPDKVICVGLNYKDHCDEQNKPYPEKPFFFTKFPSTIIGPNQALFLPTTSRAVDWEVELAVVIGRKAKHVSAAQAYDYVFGYTVAQDISARDWQTPEKNYGQWLMAKSMDKFCPLGPHVVTKDQIPDPHNLHISSSINGVVKQNSSTKELIHRIDKLISYLSDFFTLLPGDVILTGTPGGVGVFQNPKQFLKNGDEIRSEISSIGVLVTPVQAS